MRHPRLAALLTLAIVTTLHAAEVPTEQPLSAARLALVDGPTRQVRFVGRWRGQAGLAVNPTKAVSALRINGAPGEGDSGVIVLPADKWRALPRGEGFRYRDKRGSAGGVTRVVLRTRARGGTLRIEGGRQRWAYSLDQVQTAVTATLTIGRARWCAAFDGGSLQRGQRRLDGRSRTAPAACDCISPFASTWATLQSAIFERHGCTSAVCHGDATAGGLDLRPDVAYANLVDAPSTALPSQRRVEPGDHNVSLLWRKLAKATTPEFGDVPGSPMPSGLPAISRQELDAIQLWIRAGAPETGIVGGTDELLSLCLPPADPIKIRPPDAPAADAGVQFYAPPWVIPANGEGEVCFATWFDLSNTIPASQQAPCPDVWGGPTKQCFFVKGQEFTQDPNSHHSIVHVYRGTYGVDDPGWGTFTCHGGEHDGTPCQPDVPGVPAPAGAECGTRSACAGTPIPAFGCLGYGPPDYNVGFSVTNIGTSVAPAIHIATQPYLATPFPTGVYDVLPVTGVMVWNSHAFNVTDQPATNEQWLNAYFAAPAERRYPLQDIFDADDIFVANVPPFAEAEYCRTRTFERGTRLVELSSHTHKRGALFRAWGPGIWPPCEAKDATCLPEAGPPILVTTNYSDPALVRFDPPMQLDDEVPASRTFKFCARYDNGKTSPDTVRRQRNLPFGTAPCSAAEVRCLGGARQGLACTTDADCESSPGQGDGTCDACPLRGGLTTEDEMFILLGGFYCTEGSDCEAAIP